MFYSKCEHGVLTVNKQSINVAQILTTQNLNLITGNEQCNICVLANLTLHSCSSTS